MNSLGLHVRRYTTSEEASQVGGVVDVRRSDEHRLRVAAVAKYLPSDFLARIGEIP